MNINMINHLKVSLVLLGSSSSLSLAINKEHINKLGDENYELREDAEAYLTKWAEKEGESGRKMLRDLMTKEKSPEILSRLDNILRNVVIAKPIANTKGYLGLVYRPIVGGVVIVKVISGKAAAYARIRIGDVILKIDNIDLTKKSQNFQEATNFLRSYTKTKRAGEKMILELERDGERLIKKVKLGKYVPHKRRKFFNIKK